jgi:hypothetical protein
MILLLLVVTIHQNAQTLAFILDRLNVLNDIRVLYFCEEEDNEYVNQQIHKLQMALLIFDPLY